MQQKKSLSKLLGSALAHVQSLADDVFHYGFKKLREASKETPQRAEAGIVGAVKKIASFLGDSGESYYETYDGIKAKKAQRSQQKQHHDHAEE